MTYVVYFLCVYGISFYLAEHFDEQKEQLLINLTSQPSLYNYVNTLLYCQACQSFWIGWLVQLYVFNILLPYYAFACFGLVHLINKFRS